MRWPVKLLLPLGFALLALQGVSELIKRVAVLQRHDARRALRKAAAMMPHVLSDGAADVRRPDPVHADRLSGRVLARRRVGLFFGLLAIDLGYFRPSLLQALPVRVFGIMSNELLLAIPFFTFMGAILERCGLAEDLLDGIGQLFGPVRGGLAYAVIIVGAILGAITGTVAASVIAMGMISLPVMMRYGYDMKLATGVIAASGTITQLIPPSLVLVVLADQLGKSVGDMYAGAIGPSILQVAAVLPSTSSSSRIVRPQQCRRCPRRRARCAAGALLARCLSRHGAVAGADLPGARHDLHGLATPTEARRHGRGRRDGAGRAAPRLHLAAALGGHGHRPCASPPW